MTAGASLRTARRGTARWLQTAAVAGAVLLGGCSPGGGSGDGELVLFAALRTDAAGRLGPAATELTAEGGFDDLGLSGPSSVSGAPELPELRPGVRRFAFVLLGCRHDSARLVIADGVVRGELLEDGSTDATTVCDAPARFLAVFDVPADDLPDDVRVG